MVCQGLWSKEESQELGFEPQTAWGHFADWQVATSRQTEWWNWTSACQKISNYVLEFWKAAHLGIARCMMFNICGVKLKCKRGVHAILHLKQNYVGCLVSFLFTLCWYLFYLFLFFTSFFFLSFLFCFKQWHFKSYMVGCSLPHVFELPFCSCWFTLLFLHCI